MEAATSAEGGHRPRPRETPDLREAVLRVLDLPVDGSSLTPAAEGVLRIIARREANDVAGAVPANNPMREVRSRIGDRWSTLIVLLLGTGSYRPATLRRLVSLISVEDTGISHRVLTVHLRQLERDGLVRRTVISAVPLSVEYALTPLGQSFLSLWAQLREWIFANGGAIREAQRVFDAAHADEAR